MQEQDWGKYSQAPWITGGAWKDSDKSSRSKKSNKTNQSAQLPTTKPTCTPSSDNESNQDETNFYTEVDLADIQIKLRRWNFARSWKTPSSNPPAEETNISPRCLPIDLNVAATCPDKEPPLSAFQTDTNNETTAFPHHPHNTAVKPAPALDEDLMAQYLNRCIAAAEAQLAGARDKSRKKKGAVKEIERLVEKVVEAQANLTGSQG